MFAVVLIIRFYSMQLPDLITGRSTNRQHKFVRKNVLMQGATLGSPLLNPKNMEEDNYPGENLFRSYPSEITI